MSAQLTPRDHWHHRATTLAQLDCSLLNLLSWDQQTFSSLQPDLYALVLRKLDELAGDACRQEALNIPRQQIELQMTKAIWNFLKPWRRAEAIETISSTGET
jgi:hypothetical protein